MSREPIRLELFTKKECPLCDKAELNIRKALQNADGVAVQLQKRDIEQDGELYEQYKWLIPVLRINGRQTHLYHVHPKQLAKQLKTIWKRQLNGKRADAT